MRSTCEIVADLKDGKEVPYEELKMACLVQSGIIHFFQNDTKQLLAGSLVSEVIRKMNYSDPETSSAEAGIPTWYWKAIHADPVEWLGPKWIPGTPEWERMHSIHKKIYEKALSKGGEAE